MRAHGEQVCAASGHTSATPERSGGQKKTPSVLTIAKQTAQRGKVTPNGSPQFYHGVTPFARCEVMKS